MKHTARKIVLLCCILALCLTGCAAGKSTVKFIPLTEQEMAIGKMISDNLGIFEFTYQSDVQGHVLHLDTWFQGACIRSDVLSFGGNETLDKLYLAPKVIQDQNGQFTGTQWQWNLGGAVFYNPLVIPFPEVALAENIGWGFNYWSCEKGAPLEANQSYVLAAGVFDLFGNGIHSYNCEALANDLSVVQVDDGNEYMILYLDTYATAEEAEAAANEL